MSIKYKGYLIKAVKKNRLNPSWTCIYEKEDSTDSCTFACNSKQTLKEIEQQACDQIDQRLEYLNKQTDINSVCTFLNN